MLLALWAHPRSLSTVFGRVMIERGDLLVLHEPFSYLYYGPQGRRRLADMVPAAEHPHRYAEIRALCLRAAAERPTFV